MLKHRITCRVIYADTDRMGFVYHADYFRWFEMARTEMLRSSGLPYKTIEAKGIFLPVSEVYCKFTASAQYDDLLIIETSIDPLVKGGMKFDYRILSEDGKKIIARGYTKHACLDRDGRVVRPPKFLMEHIRKNVTV